MSLSAAEDDNGIARAEEATPTAMMAVVSRPARRDQLWGGIELGEGYYTLLEFSNDHDVQPATTGPVPNVSLSCLEAARQEVLAEATQLVGNRNASRLRAVVTAEDIQMELAETNRIAVKIMCATVVGMAGFVVFTVWASTKCPSDDNCKSWRRRDNVNKIEQCKHLDSSAYNDNDDNRHKQVSSSPSASLPDSIPEFAAWIRGKDQGRS
ncbi:hypothetical protein F5877DRAFT_71250 [Lentinula edodes]|nr:hypothetical protein F5877DRAFT_71250 [Lentinula edodes]